MFAVVGKHTFMNIKNKLKYRNGIGNKTNTSANIKVRHNIQTNCESVARDARRVTEG